MGDDGEVVGVAACDEFATEEACGGGCVALAEQGRSDAPGMGAHVASSAFGGEDGGFVAWLVGSCGAVAYVEVELAVFGGDVDGVARAEAEEARDACGDVDASAGVEGEVGAPLVCQERLHSRSCLGVGKSSS